MPIEVFSSSPGNRSEQPVKIVSPGGYLAIPDYSSGEKQALVVYCNHDDSGGSVHLVDAGGLPEKNANGAISTNLLRKKENQLGAFGLGGEFERILTNENGTAQDIFLKHTFDIGRLPTLDDKAQKPEEVNRGADIQFTRRHYIALGGVAVVYAALRVNDIYNAYH